MSILLIIIISYLIGSIQSGILIGKIIYKTDVRQFGSKSSGATNIQRTIGLKPGIFVLVLDIFKGFLPILFIEIFTEENIFGVMSCIFLVLGHCYPVFHKFKGGKGVATYVGILFCINIYLAVIFIIVWFVVFVISKYSSLASMIASLFVPLSSYFLFNDINYYFYIILFSLILITHRENIKRLKNNTESKTKIY